MENLVKFGGAMTAKINFAMQQNYVPVFRSVVVTNISDSIMKNVFLRINGSRASGCRLRTSVPFSQ